MLANDQPQFFATMDDLDWYSDSHRCWIDDLELSGGDAVVEIGPATAALTAYVANSG